MPFSYFCICICGRSRLVRVIEVAQTSLEFLDDLAVGFASAGIHQVNTILVSHFTNFFGHHSYLLLLVFMYILEIPPKGFIVISKLCSAIEITMTINQNQLGFCCGVSRSHSRHVRGSKP